MHPVPVLCVLLSTAIFALVARYPPHLPTVLRLLGSMAGIQLAIGALNDYVDLPLDRQAKPWKPLVRGDLRPRTALLIAAVGLGAALLLVAPLGLRATMLALLGAGAGIGYDLLLKTTRWSWLPYLVALPLLPIWVWTTVRGWDARLLTLYPLGALLVVSLHLANTLPDITADTGYGVRGFAHWLGPRWATRLCWLSAAVSPLLAIVAALAGWADLRRVLPAALLALLLSGLAIGYDARSQRCDWRIFFTLLAAAAVTLGLGWLLALS